ncbi:MAG TPA: hypothetical protein VN842_02920 [Thermoplasmata archaeon]|nr:hypothetical protein [Thermoplasmata archaeon]
MYDPYRPTPPRPLWPFLVVSTVVVLVAVVLVVLFLDSTGRLGPTSTGGPTGIFAYGFFPVFVVLLLVMFLVRIVFWSRMWGRRGGGNGHAYGDRAVSTVRQRYARGEITREQYDQLMTELSRRRPGP